MQTGTRGFAGNVETGNVGTAMQVADDATAGIVSRRHDRNRLACDVDTQFQAACVNIREMLPDERFAFVGDIQEDAIEAALFHLEVDGPGDDVTRRQFAAIVVFGHEAGAIRQAQQSTFATHRFRDQE